MTENIEQASGVIKKIFSLDDPLSLTETQRKEKYSFAEFLECDVESLKIAFSQMKGLPPHGLALFNFSLATKIQHEHFMNTNFVWDKYGLPKEPVLLNVKFDVIRRTGDFFAQPVTINSIGSVLQENPDDAWANHYLPILQSFETPMVYVLYTDDELSRQHGFPFDLGIPLSIPQFDDDSQIPQLFMKCLREGFNVLDTYQLFNFEQDIINAAYAKMMMSGRFDVKQLEYINSFVRVKPILDSILEDDGISEGFKKSDTKRYTEVMFSPKSLPNLTIRKFSEHGEISKTTQKLSNFKILNELGDRTAELDSGDHMFRFFNQQYTSDYGDMMWVPFLLKGGEVSFPRKSP